TRTIALTASYDTVTLSAPLTLNAVGGVTVSALTTNVTDLRGGEGGVATVNLASPAPATVLLNVSTSHAGLFSSLPSTLVDWRGPTRGSLASPTQGWATPERGGPRPPNSGPRGASGPPRGAPPADSLPPVTSLALSPTSVTAGGASTATVTLQAAAPPGGA